jgi:hypothetical protein
MCYSPDRKQPISPQEMARRLIELSTGADAPRRNAMVDAAGLPRLRANAMLNYLAPFEPQYPPQPPFDCSLRRAAWIRTAGHVDAPWCYDEEGVRLERNAKLGDSGYWEAAHYHDAVLGGPNAPWNVRALNGWRNRSDGGYLGNAMKQYRG